jgi:hypothetical protein
MYSKRIKYKFNKNKRTLRRGNRKQNKRRKKTNKKIKKTTGGKIDNSRIKKVISNNFDHKPRGGVYCYMPYESLNEDDKSNFKIDSAMDINLKNEELKKFYPEGFFVIACLFDPNKEINNLDQIDYYGNIISHILNIMLKNGGEIQKQYEKGWIYSKESTIHDAFQKSYEVYGGDLEQYSLIGRDENTFKLIDVKKKSNPEFVGKVVFHT